jgi:hypothetical protein
MGLSLPFENLNDMFRGMRLGKFFCNGFLSNEGKTRLVALVVANTSLIHGEKTLVWSMKQVRKILRHVYLQQ